MQWFLSWWEALSTLQQAFACVAIPATVILLLQTILLLFGVGGDHDADGGDTDFDHDTDHDFDHDHGEHVAGLRIFTVRGIVAFLSVGGWLGIVLLGTGLHVAVSCLLAFLGGLLSLLLVAAFLKWSVGMQESGNLSYQNAIGRMGQVYLSIPAGRSGRGKVTLTVQERYIEADAVTDSNEPIPVGRPVTVTALADDQTLLVAPLAAEAANPS